MTTRKITTSKIDLLNQKVSWVRKETLELHRIAPETRLASSLSDIDILVALYYGRILRFNPCNPHWEKRDRFIASKGHGAVSLYPILADFGFFEMKELKTICQEGSFLGGIPDTAVPGFETVNGSLGNGLGVACGMAIALKNKGSKAKVFVLLGDGELYEGSIWEAVMFASHHRLDNIIAIVDNNKISMLDYCKNIIDLEPLPSKFGAFGWKVDRVNGHNIKIVYQHLLNFKRSKIRQPKVLIADTIKGKGVPQLERDSLCHIKSLNNDEIDRIVRDL